MILMVIHIVLMERMAAVLTMEEVEDIAQTIQVERNLPVQHNNRTTDQLPRKRQKI